MKVASWLCFLPASEGCYTTIVTLLNLVSALRSLPQLLGSAIFYADGSGINAWDHRQCSSSLDPSLSQDRSEVSAVSVAVNSATQELSLRAIDILPFNLKLLQFFLGSAASSGRLDSLCGFVALFSAWKWWLVYHSCRTSVFSLCPSRWVQPCYMLITQAGLSGTQRLHLQPVSSPLPGLQ